MTPIVVALIGGAVVGGALSLIKRPTSSTGTEIDMGTGNKATRKLLLWNMVQSIPELTPQHRLFAILTAEGESDYNPRAHNDSPSEVQASRNAWDNNPTLAAKLRQAGYGGPEAWARGSGGYPGRLMPYFGDDMIDIGIGVLPPEKLFVPVPSLVSLLAAATKLQQTNAYKAGPQTVGALRVGFYGIGYMDNPPPDRIEKYKRAADDAKIPRSFVDERIAQPFPSLSKLKGIYQRLCAAGFPC